ncbi:MAG TPA: DUF1501 domain-containing protein, partial [Pyrinomonadaceae bacterium]|nr:DUF1501 domain-containing protein [Pyrinomonadaceae bacterium]
VSGYSDYSAGRAAQGLAHAQNTLLPIAVPRVGGLSYGMHPNFGTVAGGINPGIHPLWAQGKLAAVTNVGTLVRPMTRAQYLDGSVPRPRQLFSHTDQSNQHMNARADMMMLTGWGGRIADKVTLTTNPDAIIPTVTSINGARLFTIGEQTQPLSLGPAPTPLSSALTLLGYNGTPASNARFQALVDEMNLTDGNDLVTQSNAIHQESIRISQSLNNASETTVAFPNTSIGNQLKQVARLIKARDGLSMNKQVFFCTVDGFDTHAGQLVGQANLFTQFSQAARAFYDEMTAQTMDNDVTLFTLSDFNRTFGPGGSGTNVGSDHAWASQLFVMGGAVLGGDFYGKNTSNGTPFPQLIKNGPDDSDSGTAARGRWIPTTSVEQYAATLAKWFGLPQADMGFVFPNLGNFDGSDLGFMQP